ncbi:MAG: hypothetical protein KBE09_01500 [Candidatus Pacebacteria bacterium]|nr:hypothetical protein [Candidatus Paceibacterota bacterium]
MFDLVHDERFAAFELTVRKAFDLVNIPDDDTLGPRVAFLRHKALCWVTCTPRDVWFDAPSRVAVWDSSAPLPIIQDEHEWQEIAPLFYVAYHLGCGATCAATVLNGMSERVFIWLDEEGNLPDGEYIVQMLAAYRKQHADHGFVP